MNTLMAKTKIIKQHQILYLVNTKIQLYLQMLFYICVHIQKQYVCSNNELKRPFSDRGEYIESNLLQVRNSVENISPVGDR